MLVTAAQLTATLGPRLGSSLGSMVSSAFDLTLVILGFGLVIFIHELGHFVAARWAGIRVLTFAMGFGPAAVSYRQGLGWRRGSSEGEYIELLRSPATRARAAAVSPTEYRLNVLPFGGYVRMLGQDDLDPGAVSAASDSYQNCPPMKRMVVISAGVIMNVILAAVLFVIVFMAGLRVPPAIVGDTAPGSPAARTVAANAEAAGVTQPGLQPGDQILSINGRTPNSFNDLVLATAMSRRGSTVDIVVRREGVSDPLTFRITPETGRLSGLQEIGVEPGRSARVARVATQADAEELNKAFARVGVFGVEPGMAVVAANGKKVTHAADLRRAFRESGGAPVRLEFTTIDGRRHQTDAPPQPEFEFGLLPGPTGTYRLVEHLLGLTGVMRVAGEDAKQGLQKGDVFARVGAVEFPSLAAGMAEIRAHANRELDLIVLRPREGGYDEVALKVEVSSKGVVGFLAESTASDSTLMALPPRSLADSTSVPAKASGRSGGAAAAGGAGGAGGGSSPPAAVGLIDAPGTRVLAVGGRAVANLADIREALRSATRADFDAGRSSTVMMTLEPPRPGPDGRPIRVERSWTLAPADLSRLHGLGWAPPMAMGVFEPEEILLRAAGVGEAVRLGVQETHRVMLTTYVTLVRLFERTVKIEHLHGPVGIVHLGTQIADKGVIWLLFLFGLVSVNLAVINFLPLPIVDGGQFLFLVWEQLRGRPAPIAVQNAATVVGLALVGTMFVVVTFNDLSRLLGF